MNGLVSQNGSDLGAVANYSCISDLFRLLPADFTGRMCTANNWDGVEPTCGELTVFIQYIYIYMYIYVCVCVFNF